MPPWSQCRAPKIDIARLSLKVSLLIQVTLRRNLIASELRGGELRRLMM